MDDEPKPDCALCGTPHHRHSRGFPNTCPIIATYRPSTPRTADVERVAQALEHIRFGLDFAYQHGLHEFGYDPVEKIKATLAMNRTAVDGDEVTEAMIEAGLNAWRAKEDWPDEGDMIADIYLDMRRAALQSKA